MGHHRCPPQVSRSAQCPAAAELPSSWPAAVGSQGLLAERLEAPVLGRKLLAELDTCTVPKRMPLFPKSLCGGGRGGVKELGRGTSSLGKDF